MSDFILGIDPGLSGGIVFFKPGEMHAFDMPVVSYKLKNKKTRREIDVYRLARILKKYPAQYCFLELIWGRGGKGSQASEFTFGEAYGMLKATIALCGIPYELVTPQAWKKHYNISKDKEEAHKLASKIFPGHADLWPLKKHDGRAEAALIANYGLNMQNLTNSRKETE